MNKNIPAHIGLLCTNLFFAANYSVVKYFTSHKYAGPFGFNIIRIAVSLFLFWLLYFFEKKKEGIRKKEIITFILCSLTAIVLNQMLFIKGLSYTFPIHASLLTLITPIMIAIIAAYLLKEKLTIEKVIGLLLGLSGALLLIATKEATTQTDNIILGDFLILLSSVAYTFYFILVKPLTNLYNAIHVMRWVFTFGFIVALPLSVSEFSQITWHVFVFKDWCLLFLLSVPGTFLAYVFNAYGIKELSASVAGAYIYSQPVFAVAIAMIFLKEELSLIKLVAAILIFAGVFLSNKKSRKLKVDNDTEVIG